MEPHPLVEQFLEGLHPSTTLLSRGVAVVCEREHDAVCVRNLYGQEIVWGVFDVVRGKYKGKRLSNDANTEEVVFTATKYF